MQAIVVCLLSGFWPKCLPLIRLVNYVPHKFVIIKMVPIYAHIFSPKNLPIICHRNNYTNTIGQR